MNLQQGKSRRVIARRVILQCGYLKMTQLERISWSCVNLLSAFMNFLLVYGHHMIAFIG